MNVVTNLMPNPSDTAKVNARQDRSGSSNQGGSGFSDTLGSFDKKPTASQPSSSGSSSAASNSSSSSASSTTSSSASTASSASSQSTTANNGTASQTSGSATPVSAAPAKPATALPTVKGLPDTTSLGGALTGATGEVPAATALPQTGVAMPTEPLDQSEIAGMTDALSDLAKLVNALANGKPLEATAEGEDAEGVVDDTTDEEGDATDTPIADDNLLSLLAASTMPKEQAVTAVGGSDDKQPAKGALTGLAGLADGTTAVDGDATASTTVVKLTKENAPSIDMHIAAAEDGKVKVDVSMASGAHTDVVQVVDSRRYLALAPTANAAAITSAVTSDPDWATAMSGQTSSTPLVTSTGQVVHTLKIQMNPVELGHVTAALKLVGDELSVHLTAHTLKGYAELQKDGSSIMDALKAQGFSVDQVTVSVATGADRQDSATANRQQGDMNQQSAQQGSQRGNEERSQEQFYRQSRTSVSEEISSNDISVQPEALDRVTSARPDHVYL